MSEADLPYRGRRLALLEPQRSLRKPELAPSERYGPRRDQDDLLPTLTQAQQILDQGFQPSTVDAPGLLIHQQRRADLDDHTARLGEGRGRGGMAGDAHDSKTILNRARARDGN